MHYTKHAEIAGFQMRHHDPRLVLRHYDMQSLPQWKDKHLRRIEGKVNVPQAGKFRERQQQLITDALTRGGEKELKKLYQRMAVLPPKTLAEGVATGAVQVIPPEPHLLAPASVNAE